MKLTQRIPSPWGRSAVVGGLLAAAAPFVLAMLLPSDPGHEQGQGEIYFVAIVAAPFCFAFGALGGIASFFIRGRAIQTGPVTLAQRGRRWAWGVSGALAGYASTELTNREWPILGGVLISLALLPVGMLVGASFALRVSRMTNPARAILGGCIGAAAACTIVNTTVWLGKVPVSQIQLQWIEVGIGALVGVIAYLALRRDESTLSRGSGSGMAS